MNAVRVVDEAQLSALYRALLGRDPDSDAEMLLGQDVDEVIHTIRQSDEGGENLRAMAAVDALSRGIPDSVVRDAAMVIERTGGTGAVPFPMNSMSPIHLFGYLPWQLLAEPNERGRVRILGPWGNRMRSEWTRRFPHTRAKAGLPARLSAGQDILVLTDPLYLFALSTYWHEIIARTKRRIIVPAGSGRASDPRSLLAERVLDRLHADSFIQVTSAFRRRPDVVALIATTDIAPGGQFRRIPHSDLGIVESPSVMWLVGNRNPQEDR